MGEEEEEKEAIEGEGEGEESWKSEAKMSRKEKRKERKKMKRKQVRREAAEKERDEEERRMNDPEEQRRLKEAEEAEKERAERERKAFEDRERAWLEEMERRRKLEEEEEKEEEEEANKLQVGKGNNCLDNDEDEWEYVEEGPAEIIWQGNEIIVRKKKVKVPKKNANRLSTGEDDGNRPISNPLPPQSESFAEYQNSSSVSAQELLENVAQQVPNFGTEQDKAHCPFHLKTGACRFGQRCSRVHFYPDKACTLLIKNMYNGPGLAWEQDEGLEVDEEVERSYEEFYEDVHTEFLKYGEMVNFKVCKNGSFHLRGNVYVHYKSVDSAVLAYHSINSRYFAGKQVMCEFVNVTRWKVAICGEYMKSRLKTCSRGTVCNFIHCFRNPGGDYEWADWDKPPPRYWVKKMAALFGNSDELVYEKQMELENLKSVSKRKPDDAGRHRARSRSQDMDHLIPRSSSVAEDDVQKGTHRQRHVNDYRKRSKFLVDEENPRDHHQRHVNDYRKRSKFLDDEENPRDRHHCGSRKYDSGSDEGCLSSDVGRGRKRCRHHGRERKRSKCSSITSEGSTDSSSERGGANLLDSKERSDGASFDDGDRTYANKFDGYKDFKKHSSPHDGSPRPGSEAKGSLVASTGTGKELRGDKDKHRCRHKCRYEKNSGNQELIGCPAHEYHDTGRRHGSDSSDDQFHRDKKRSCERHYSRGLSEVSDEGSASVKRLRESSHGYICKSRDSDSRYSSAEPIVVEDRWEPQNHDLQYDRRSEPHDSIGDYPDNGRTDRLSPHKSEKQSCERALDSKSNFALDEGYYISKSTSLDRKSSGSYKKSRATDQSQRRSKKHSRSDKTRTVYSEERQEVDEKERNHLRHRSHVGKDHEK